jgi:hypothetical protein
MHPYSTPDSRALVYATLTIPAIIAAWLIYLVTSPFDWPEWLVSAPSVLGTYVLFHVLFDRYVWDWKISRLLGLSKIPNIGGTYEGELISAWKDKSGHPTRLPVRFEIIQTWSQIQVFMKITTGSSTSQSESGVASISAHPHATRLRYIYTNKVNPGIADEDMSDHDGTAEILVDPSGAMTGTYFNARPRKGSIAATRVPPSTQS